MTSTDTLIRAELVSFARDPGDDDLPTSGSLEHYNDGVLWLREGHIQAVGYADLVDRLPLHSQILDYRGKLILPGLSIPTFTMFSSISCVVWPPAFGLAE
ncbi:hypothetical protein DK37_27940 [Halomonas sp. SUBG004]|nr:hypothetical protein DK37_27940 [Halomonas sp. SUBG004]